MANVVDELRRRCPNELDVIDWYGSTGNIAVRSPRPSNVGALLERTTERPWVVLGRHRVEQALIRLREWPPPRTRTGNRWTPGLAFAVSGKNSGPVAGTDRAMLLRVDHGVVAVYKNDALVGQRLDPKRRRGGWGAISTDLQRQVGGIWTARSRKPIEGLLNRLE
jgi:hypothetical protein